MPGTAPETTSVGGVHYFTTPYNANQIQVQATIPASAAPPGPKLFERLKAVGP